MAEKHFEPDDPFQPVAVALSTPGHDGMAEMARCFVEKFAIMGWPPQRIFKLFTIPEFAGSHSVYQERGRAYVKEIIASVMGPGSIAELEADDLSLPVVAPQRSHEARANGPVDQEVLDD